MLKLSSTSLWLFIMVLIDNEVYWMNTLNVMCARYNMPVFSVRLNEMTPGLEAKLPPTDVRSRWDLRALEQGKYQEVRTFVIGAKLPL